MTIRCLQLLTLFSILCQMAACAGLGRQARIDPASVSTIGFAKQGGSECSLTTTLIGDRRNAIDLDCFKFHKSDTKTAYELASKKVESTSGSLLPRDARNRLEGALLNHSNIICENEKGLIYAKRAFFSSALDFGSSGFSIASTIVGGDLARSILSGMAGLATATRTNVDSNVYKNQLVPAITKVIDAERSRLSTQIKARRTNPISEYSVDQMIMQVNRYHQACSFQKGVELLLDAAINKEGVDRILEGINVRAANKVLLEQRKMLKKLGSNEADSKVAEIDKLLGDNVLLYRQNAIDAKNVTLETTQIEEDGQPDDQK